MDVIFREYIKEDQSTIKKLVVALNDEDLEELPLNEKKIEQLFAFAPNKNWVELFVAEKNKKII